MQYSHVQVFISSVSGDWDLLDFLINKNINIHILSTFEKPDYGLRILLSPQLLLENSVCIKA